MPISLLFDSEFSRAGVRPQRRASLSACCFNDLRNIFEILWNGPQLAETGIVTQLMQKTVDATNERDLSKTAGRKVIPSFPPSDLRFR